MIATATTAPAFAASTCNFSLPPPAQGVWRVTNLNMSTNGGTDRFANDGYVVVQDPASGATATVLVRSPTVTFQAGRTYRFTYNFTTFPFNALKLTMVCQVAGLTPSGGGIDSDNSPRSGTEVVTYRPTTTTTGSVTFRFDFATSFDPNATGDDITVSNFTSACS